MHDARYSTTFWPLGLDEVRLAHSRTSLNHATESCMDPQGQNLDPENLRSTPGQGVLDSSVYQILDPFNDSCGIFRAPRIKHDDWYKIIVWTGYLMRYRRVGFHVRLHRVTNIS